MNKTDVPATGPSAVAEAKPGEGRDTALHQATVLVVDDEVGIVEGLKSWLEINDRTVFTASCGLDALDILKTHPIDVMITDLRMPRMGGLELLSQAADIYPDLPVIVLTGHGDLSNAIEALNRGAAAYMLKPLDLDELGIHLDRCLHHSIIRRTRSINLKQVESILASMADALIVASPEGTIQTVNPPACKMLGCAKEEITGDLVTNLFDEESAFGTRELESLLQTGFLSSTESTLRSKDGHRTPVLISGSVRRDTRGAITGVVLVAKDITEYKQAQEALREREAQLVHTGRLTAMGEMAAGIAHELNQPLAVIRIWSQSLGNDVERGTVSPQRVAQATREMAQQMDRATTIITHMRAFARGETDEAAGPTNLAIPANEALLFFQEQFRIHEIELVTEIANDLPAVSIHANRFEQIVVNLLSNARYALDKKESTTPAFQKKVTLRLQAGPNRDSVILEVADTGVGMAAADRSRCLEPFFTTKVVGQGTGLGLHIIRGIVNELAGQIDVESQPGEGALFRIHLPAIRQP